MWHSNNMFHYMIKSEFVTLVVSLKVPSGSWDSGNSRKYSHTTSSKKSAKPRRRKKYFHPKKKKKKIFSLKVLHLPQINQERERGGGKKSGKTLALLLKAEGKVDLTGREIFMEVMECASSCRSSSHWYKDKRAPTWNRVLLRFVVIDNSILLNLLLFFPPLFFLLHPQRPKIHGSLNY